MRLLVFITILFSAFSIVAQPPMSIEAQYSFGGENNDNGYAVTPTSDGGLLLVGSTNSNDSYDIPSSNGHLGNGGSDFLVMKLDMFGRKQWTKIFGGSKDDMATDVVRTNKGEYVVVGTSYSLDGDANFNGPNGGILIIRLKEDGSLVSRRIIPGGRRFTESTFHYASEFAQPSIKLGPNGELYLGATHEIGSNPYNAKDFYLAKLTENIDTLWERFIGSPLDEQMSDLVVSSKGEILMVGSTTAFPNQIEGAGNGNLDFLAIKVNSNGQVIWKKGWGGSSVDALHGAIESVDKSGFILVGETTSEDGIVKETYGQKDAFVMKIDHNGNLIWSKTVGGDGNDFVFNIIHKKGSQYMLLGTSDSNVIGVPQKGPLTDALTIEVSESGELSNMALWGGEDIDVARAGVKISDESWVFIGISRSAQEDLTNNYGENDMWVVFLSPPTPIGFKSFTGEIFPGGEADLIWITTYQKGAALIRLEKSLDGKNYNRLKDFTASTNSTSSIAYTFTDLNLMVGDNHYRLKYYDAAGKEFKGPSLTLSQAPLAVASQEPMEIKVYPNPSIDRIVVPLKDAEAQFTLLDVMGHSLPFYTQFDPSKGWTFDIAELKSGTYLLKCKGSAYEQTHRFAVF